MNQKKIKAHNMDYLRLDEKQYDEHVKLMEMKMSDWPVSLYQYCVLQSKAYGMSGDAIACWVSEWLRDNPPKEQP